MRLNINLPDDLIKKIDEKAQELNVSRSAYISFSCSQNIKADEALKQFPELLKVLSGTRSELESHMKEYNHQKSHIMPDKDKNSK